MRFVAVHMIFILLTVLHGQAQSSIERIHDVDSIYRNECKVTIREIFLSGNKKTKDGILLREIPVVKGASYSMPYILRSIQRANENLMNTTLFVSVKTDFTHWYNDSIDIVVQVSERWYYIPLPLLEPVDRNWNVWITQHNVSLDRINYGLRLRAQNITGRNDRLNLFLIGGYTRQYMLKYENPFISKDLRHGVFMEMSYSRKREINYTTRKNQQVFFNDDNIAVSTSMRLGLGYSYRKGSIVRHSVKLFVYKESIADTIATLNPKYFANGQTDQLFPELQYRYQYLGVDYIPYPLRGFKTEFNFLKRGAGGHSGVNLWLFNLRLEKFFALTRTLNLSIQGEGILKLPFDQPFYNQKLLGYGNNYLRGLEYYVIDGVAGGMINTTIRKRVADFKIKTGLSSKTYAAIPFQVYLKAYGDAGYVYNKQNITGNTLTNKWLYTGGVGLDVVTIYDLILRLEFSFNQLRERAMFIHMNDF